MSYEREFHPVADLFPLMEGVEFEQLCEDIQAHGLREAIWIHPECGRIIDGRNRYRACEVLGKTPSHRVWSGRGSLVAFVISQNLHRRHLTPSQKACVAVDILPMLEEEAKERQKLSKGRGKKGPEKIPDLKGDSRDQAASAVGVNPRYVSDAKTLRESSPDLFEKVRSGEQTLTEAKRAKKEEEREARRAANLVVVKAAPSPQETLGELKAATIVVDPPWDFSEEGDDDPYGIARPTYHQMSMMELVEEPIPDFADDDCHLYLWITNRSLITGKGWKLCEAWGFRPVTLITWCKPSIGVGNYFRNNTEHVIFAVKGSQPLKVKNVGTWFEAKRGPRGHSSKPTEFITQMVKLWSPTPILEWFGREEYDDPDIFVRTGVEVES